ncbi:MAG: amylo-alpha-1,6-glucosidase [Elusimicrobiota bacterium]
MQKIIRVKDQFYILANSSLVDDRTLVLKQGETFGVFDRHGDIAAAALAEQGLFHEGTRHLSRFTFNLDRARPLLLSSTVTKDNILLAADLTNPAYSWRGREVPRGALHFFRSKFLWEGACYERLRVCNYGRRPVTASFLWEFEADFADIFEVRGTRRASRGRLMEGAVEGRRVRLRYEGLDGVARQTRLEFSRPPASLSAGRARFEAAVKPGEEEFFYVVASCEKSAAGSRRLQASALASPEGERRSSYDAALAAAMEGLRMARTRDCVIESSSEQFNGWINGSLSDLHMMISRTPDGPYPYAGVPWFSTPFGRDGLLTALECLWVNPSLARGVLSFLAARQATESDAARDAEPGKILHETRRGEMAALQEIPFGLYYGSVDSTPLFVVLAGAYHRTTGDRAFAEKLWPHVERALSWMDEAGDADGDGFVEYQARTPRGLAQQGWKDSEDSVFHADGESAEPPIALCEVQGYVYAAKREAAALAEALGRGARARALREQAEAMRDRFDRAFWCADRSVYALALDGKKRPCRVASSNAGHALFSGIARPERAAALARTLLAPPLYSGWGLRTLGVGEARFNPMSYHNGSVWPHDNALVARGLADYGFKDEAVRILSGLFDASAYMDLRRLPELFCGFVRREGAGPTAYPVACSPQAWAAGAVFMLLGACLGLSLDAPKGRILLDRPLLPPFLEELKIRNLRLGDAVVDLAFHRGDRDVGIHVLRREGRADVVVMK